MKHSTSAIFIGVLCGALLLNCKPGAAQESEVTENHDIRHATPSPVHDTRTDIVDAEGSSEKTKTATSLPDQKTLRTTYPWLDFTDDLPELTTLDRHIATPSGYTRQDTTEGSYAHYLRGLPVRTDRKEVKLYTGEDVSMPSAGIIPLDLGSRDLHQCADSVIRLYAEYLWIEDRANEAEFHYTSGDLARWKDWRKGKVLKVKGNKVVQVKAKASPNTHKAYRKWLDKVFMYASTRSLNRDSKRIKKSKDLQSGDFFLQGGSPGHVVMILDIAENKSGERIALLGQGFLPAREFHVISGDGDDVIDGVWYKLSDEGTLATPTWRPFSMDDAWRFE